MWTKEQVMEMAEQQMKRDADMSHEAFVKEIIERKREILRQQTTENTKVVRGQMAEKN